MRHGIMDVPSFLAELPLHEAMEGVDYAARQSLAWWFIALLVIGLTAMVWMWRYFVLQIDKLQAEIVTVRGEFEQHLKTANQEMVAALTRATQAIEQNSRILVRLSKDD